MERFVYCAHNWWLAKQGHDADKDAMRGVEAHNRIGEALHETERHRRENLRALRWSFRGAAVAGALTIATLAIIGFDRTAESYILLTAALVMLNGSVGLLTIAMVEERTIKRIQREMGLVPGVLVDDDLAGDGELLHDADWDLHGRPDYILEVADGRRIPIEVKSSRPRQPYDSHRMQLACYMRLMEVQGEAVEYGMLTYPHGVFRVDWDAAMRDRLRGVLARMQEAEAAGAADRDHNHVARCKGCARRDACKQRL